MEFFENNQTLIIIIVIAIIIIAAGSLITRIRRKKQEEEINNTYNYSSSSKPKVPKSPVLSQANDINTMKYRFDPLTGEEINKAEQDDLFSSPVALSDEEVIRVFEKNIAKTDLSEKQKKKALELFKKYMPEQPIDNIINIEERIKVIENSNLSDIEKKKLIELLKDKSNSQTDFKTKP